MKTHTFKVTVPEDHQLEIHLPSDFPAGPAEVIVLASSGSKTLSASQKDMVLALEELKALKLTPEEERILDEFEEFQQQHPINLSSLGEEDS
ncbi:MAG TPA: hypothetical protein VGG20_03640 [Thermoanaerobaculia bacterium]|jgi:hypothetical protein